MATFAEHMATDMARVIGGEFSTTADWAGSPVPVTPLYADYQERERLSAVVDELDVLVAVAEVAQPAMYQQVTVDGEVWAVNNWRRENQATWRVTLRRNERPVI